MSNADIIYVAKLDDDGVVEGFKDINKEVDKTGERGQKAFDKIAESQKKTEEGAERTKASFGGLKTAAASLGAAVAGAIVLIQQAFELANEASANLRIERTFFQAAEVAEQSGERILEAIDEASRGTINRFDAMRQANLALSLGVAETPEAFAKLTESALVLGQATGLDATESIETLINAAGKRSTEVLDNLGISLAEVNTRMAELAEQRFDTPVTQLDQAQRNALFMEATLDAASNRAEELGGFTEDLGIGLQASAANAADLKQEVGELSTIALTFLNSTTRALTGDEDIFAFLSRSVEGLQKGLILIQALLAGIGRTTITFINEVGRPFEQLAQNIRAISEGRFEDLAAIDLSGAGERIGSSFGEGFEDSLRGSLERFEEILDPEAAAKNAANTARAVQSEIEKAGIEAEAAQGEIADEQAKIAEDLQKRLLDIQTKAERQRTEDAIKNAERRTDIARRNADKLEDIARKNADQIEDAARNLTRAEEDIARDQADKRIDIQRDLLEERVTIEQSTADEIKRIREQASFDSAEAERTNDARRFLEIQRSANRQIAEVESTRTEDLANAEVNAREQTEALKVENQRQLEDARIKNQRALEDLQIRLEREFEAQAIANERALEEQALAEQRQADQRARANELALQDFRTLEAEKNAALQESLAEQFAAIENFNNLQIEKAKATAAAIVEIQRQVAQTGVEESNPFGTPFSGGVGGLAGRQVGGPVGAGQSVVVGEGGPEVFTPSTAGVVTPSQAMFSPPAQQVPTVQRVSQRSVTNNPSFTLGADMFNDPIMKRTLRNFVLGILEEVG
jgi:hypothetical protein